MRELGVGGQARIAVRGGRGVGGKRGGIYTDRGCPEGWREVPMRGYVLVSRPNGSRAGTVGEQEATEQAVAQAAKEQAGAGGSRAG